jgi:cytochrome c553
MTREDGRGVRRGGRAARLHPWAELLAAGLLASGLAGVASTSDDGLEQGRRAYEGCAVCHQPDGSGRADGIFPSIAGQHPTVVAAELEAIREGRRANPVMEPHAHELIDAEEVAAVAAYVASLPAPTDGGRGPGDDLERGAELYRRDCVRCHGPRGQGDAERLVPIVAGQHYGYLLRRARQLGSWRSSGHTTDDGAMRGYSDAELRAVVDYATRLPGRSKAGGTGG